MGRESCIIQRITIVEVHDNNCTIIITAALSLSLSRAINRDCARSSLYDGPIIYRCPKITVVSSWFSNILSP